MEQSRGDSGDSPFSACSCLSPGRRKGNPPRFGGTDCAHPPCRRRGCPASWRAYRADVSCQLTLLTLRYSRCSLRSWRPSSCLLTNWRAANLGPSRLSGGQGRLKAGCGQNCPPSIYALLFFGGRHLLCGIGVTSLIWRTSIPAVDKARTADSRPEPGPLTRTSTVRNPLSDALFAAVMAACCAAKGVPLRDPRKPSDPALDHETTLPS